MAGIQRAEATFGGTVEQALRDINHTTNHYYGDRPAPITSGTSVAPPWGRLTHEVRGRSELVAALTDDLGGSIAVLAAGGGFGKTTVALDVARTLPRVWWVDASSRDSLTAGLAEVALQAGADSHEVREAWAGLGGSAIELLWRSLDHQSEPWALVFDNADDPDVLAAANHRVADGNGWLRTPNSTGSILVTSRAATGWPPARVHHVRQLDPDDGAQVLLDLADAGTRQDATALARRLGGLPLALRLAGRYLAVAKDVLDLPGLEPPTTFKAYLERWDQSFTELTEGEPASPRESLSRTWEMSMDLLAERGQPQTRQLLRLISTFAEAPVPAFALDASVMATSELLRGLTAHQLSVLLRALQHVGLLDMVESSVVVHPVIRDANRHQPDFEQHRQAYTDLVVHLLGAATERLPGDQPETWSSWRLVLPHLPDLGPHEDADLDLATGTLCYRAAAFARTIGSYTVSGSFCRRAVALRTAAVGADHPSTLAARHSLGHALQNMGDLAGAEAEHRTLVADQTRVLGLAHPDSLDSRKCLAEVLRGQGRWDESEIEFRRVLRLRTRRWGSTHRDTLRARHHLGDLLEARGKLTEAESTHRRVVAAMEKHLGADHDDALSVRLCLSDLLRDLGRLDEAEAEIRDIIAVAVRHRGDDWPLPTSMRGRLAAVLRRRGRLDDAEAELRDVLANCVARFGADHPSTLNIRHDLGHLLADRNDLEAAEDEHRRVIEAQEHLLGSTHPGTLRTKGCLALIHRRQKRFDEAEAGYRSILTVKERVLGPGHFAVMDTKHDLSHVDVERGDLVAAERGHREVIAGLTRARGPLHPDTVRSKNCLASLLRRQGRLDEAEVQYREVAALETAVYGSEHQMVLTTRYRLAGVLDMMGRREDAEAQYRAVVAARTRALGADHPDTVRARKKLAALVG